MSVTLDSDPDPLFESIDAAGEDRIFARRELLDITYVPNKQRIVGREEQIQAIAQEVGPVVAGAPPNSVVIYGKTGSGKSLVSKHVMERSKNEAGNRGNTLATAYVDCGQAKGEADVVQTIGSRVNNSESDITVPERGLSTNQYYNRLWTILDSEYSAALITLDEVDQLRDDNVLMVLSRAGEAGKIDIPIGIIGISNKISFREQMSQRVRSSLGHNEYIFEPYDGPELRSILANRRDAFKDGVLADDVIPKTAALAAKEHGDARKAMRLLRHAGDYAQQHGFDHVTVKHLDQARQAAEAERLEELLTKLPPHSQYVLLALANLTTTNDRERFRTTVVFDVYTGVCSEEGAEPLGIDTVRNLLDELAFLEIIESNKEHGGRGTGTYKEHRLLWESDIVFRMR